MKRILAFCFFLLFIVSFSCKDKNRPLPPHQDHKPETVTKLLTQQKDSSKVFLPSLSILDTSCYYYATIQDKEYYIKLTKSSPGLIAGYYYPIADQPMVAPLSFSIALQDSNFKLQLPSKDILLDLEAEGNFNSITAKYVIKSNIVLPDQLKKEGEIVFYRYKSPEFVQLESERYKKQLFGVTVKKDVIYGNAKGYWISLPEQDEKYGRLILTNIGKTFSNKDLNLTMDIYLPQNDSIQDRPLIMLIHGGGFFVGDKGSEEMVKLCNYFASLGYVAVSINYRMGFQLSKSSIEKCGFKATQDAHAAMRYLVAHQDEYHLDPNLLFVGGASAGSITTLNLVFMTNDLRPKGATRKRFAKEFGDIEESGNHYKVDFHIKAIANLWGAVPNLKYLENTPVSIISFHGDSDQVIPFDVGFPFSDIKGNLGELFFEKMYGAAAIHRKAKELGLREELHVFHGAGHGPYQDENGKLNNRFYFIQDKIANFFYNEITEGAYIIQDTVHPQYFVCSNKVEKIYWKIEGGIILSSSHNKIKVAWFTDAPIRTLTVSGILKTGAHFQKTIKPNSPAILQPI